MLDISILRRRNFKENEFIFSETAEKKEIDNNIYCPYVLANANRTADKAQELRERIGQPIIITSGVRSLILNKEVEGSENSQHLAGQAIDFYCPLFKNNETLIRFIKDSDIEVDQCLLEGSWIHLSIIEKGANRNNFAYYLPDKDGIRRLIVL